MTKITCVPTQSASDVTPCAPEKTASDQEARLLERVAAQDPQAFDILYQHYAPQVRRYLARRLSQAELVDEVLNDVMMVLWQDAARIPPSAPIAAWLYGIARNKASLAWRKMSRDSTRAVEQQDDETDATPECNLLLQEQGERLTKALVKLPPELRIPVELLLYQGCSYQEIANRTETSINTIKTRLVRGRRRLTEAVAA